MQICCWLVLLFLVAVKWILLGVALGLLVPAKTLDDMAENLWDWVDYLSEKEIR